MGDEGNWTDLPVLEGIHSLGELMSEHYRKEEQRIIFVRSFDRAFERRETSSDQTEEGINWLAALTETE